MPPPSLENASGSTTDSEASKLDDTLGALLLGTLFGLL